MKQITINVTVMGFNVGVTPGGILKDTSLNIYPYIRKFEQWNYDNNKRMRVLINEFFYYDTIKQTCYFPKYDLDQFIIFLKKNRVLYKIEEASVCEGKDVSFAMLPFVDYKNDKQKNAIEFVTNKSNGHIRAIALQTGEGKAQPLSSLLKTPDDWIKMGDVILGTMLAMPDGTTAPVTGIFLQGVLPIYTITFEDGRTTNCSLDHLWRIHLTEWDSSDESKYWRIKSLEEIMQYMSNDDTGIYVPLSKPIEKPDVNVPIDPYFMGVILTNTKGFKCTYINKLTHKAKCVFNSVMSKIKLKNMWSCEKEIPQIYMNSSPSQKLSLVQGLMDTDGVVNFTSNNIEFCTTSIIVAKQLQNIIWSLGGICEIINGSVSYKVIIKVKDPTMLFRIPHKKDIVLDNHIHNDSLKLRIKSIEYVGEEECQCISVYHPDHLYITDDYVVTHNTVAFIWSMQIIAKRSMTVMTSRLEQWVPEICKYTSLEEDDIFVIQGVGSLTKLFNQIDKDIHPKMILASTKTIRLYLEYGPTYQHLPHPSEMCNLLNIGIVATDEYHEHFYTNYLIGLILNPAIFIPITATFIANNPFVKEIFNQFIPRKTQFVGGAYNKFVNVTAYTYESAGKFIKPFNYTARGVYSQVRFESWLLHKGINTLSALLIDAIIPIIKEHYITISDEGEKLLYLCSTKDMCDHLCKVFKREFKNKSVSVFYSGMSSSVLETYDIIISTPGSAGTGRDIKNLRTCFVFVNAASEIQNAQFIGRLRPYPAVKNTPEFVYISFRHIPPHVKYAGIRSMFYGSRGLTFKHRSVY